MAQLAADYQSITGSALPALPAPPPPAPSPQSLLEEAAGLIRSVAASAQKDVTELLAFLASHGL